MRSNHKVFSWNVQIRRHCIVARALKYLKLRTEFHLYNALEIDLKCSFHLPDE